MGLSIKDLKGFLICNMGYFASDDSIPLGRIYSNSNVFVIDT
jgi:hypothetical protein